LCAIKLALIKNKVRLEKKEYTIIGEKMYKVVCVFEGNGLP
jgi:hypothetical protein